MAILSTNSIIESSEAERNIELSLAYFFDNMFTTWSIDNFKKDKDSWGKVVGIDRLVGWCYNFKDRISLEKFKRHELINKYFSKSEIEFMVKFLKNKDWFDRSEREKMIWINLYGEQGPWHYEWFNILASKFIEELKIGKKYEDLYMEYRKKAQIKSKRGAFEEYLKARIYFEIEKPKNNKKIKKENNGKYKYKIEAKKWNDLF